jgi:nucleotide-binding universal stress UspA family protein
MKRIMVATDFSERSDRALRRAILLARQFETSLSIVHVVDEDQPRRIVESQRDAASALLRELKRTVKNVDGVHCDFRVVLSDPFAGIARAAEAETPDLLVIGPHRRQALRDIFVGTTAERTIRSVTCPVLMVNAPPVAPYGHVMITTDLSEESKRVVKTGAALGLMRGARASLLHVFDAPAVHLAMSYTIRAKERQDYLDDEGKAAARSLADFVSGLELGAFRQEVRHSRHSPADEILMAAREETADLVIIGTHSRSGVAKLFLGSVAENVLRSAECDVLVIPPTYALPEGVTQA